MYKLFRRYVLPVFLVFSCLKCHLKADILSDITEQLKQLEKESKKQQVTDGIAEVREILTGNSIEEDLVNQQFSIFSNEARKPYIISKEEPEYFDFIIVGGGMCGTVVANRLSEELNFKILLLDKGPCNNSPLSSISGLSSYTFFKNYTKVYRMKPQNNFGLGLKDKSVIISTGIGLGGSSKICNTKLSRGHKTNFMNMPDWCYDTVLEYFRKPEQCRIDQGKLDSAYHNFDGRLMHSDSCQSNISDAFLQCGYEQGDEEIDIFSDFEEGVARVKSATDNDGVRQDHKKVFFDPISDRKNLKCYCDSTVIQVLINRAKKAYGVEYIKDGKLHTALARKEVILCAGIYENARLLLFSGIGPRSDLERHQIKCIQHLPVGQCIRDNMAYEGGLVFITNNTAVPSSIDDVLSESIIGQLLEEGNGHLASSNGFEAVKILKVNSDTPNMVAELYNRYYTLDGGRGLAKTVGFSNETYLWMKELEGQRVFQIKPVLSAKSCGKIKLISNNFWDDLEINGNYFQDPRDKKNMVDGIKQLLDFTKCNSFKDFGIHLWDKPYPQCRDKTNLNSYLCCMVDYLTISDEAPMGSCRMGRKEDPRSVVDQELKVIGIQGLRVGGDSIIPGPFLGNLHLMCTMVCERLADLIKAEHGAVTIKFCPTEESYEESNCDSEENPVKSTEKTQNGNSQNQWNHYLKPVKNQ